MPMPPHILDHRDRATHKSRGSDGAASIISNAAPSITAPMMSGTTLGDGEADEAEQRVVDQVRNIRSQLVIIERSYRAHARSFKPSILNCKWRIASKKAQRTYS